MLGTSAGGVIGGTSTQFSANQIDKVLLNDSTGVTRFYYYDTSTSQWQRGGSTANENNLPISPFTGLAYYRISTNAFNLTFMGAVPNTTAQFQVPVTGTTLFASYYASATTLSVLGFETLPGWRKLGDSGVTFNTVDRVLISDSFGVLRPYYHDGTTWKEPGSSFNQNGVPILPSTTIYTVRYGSGTSETLTHPIPYSRYATAIPFSISSPAASTYNLDWTAINQRKYQFESSTDMLNWITFGPQITGAGSSMIVTDIPVGVPSKFYRLRSGAIRPGFDRYVLPANDDGSTDLVPLGFSINFFGQTYSSCYINNNGNITFNGPLSTYTANVLQQVGIPIIAPFWADVDTRGVGSDLVRYSYGTETIDGHPTFGVNSINVGYYSGHTDKLNSFQLVLIDRSDTGTGNFDIEFNYEKILWETGDASSGTDGYGGFPCRVGITNGNDQTIEIANSGETLKFLDIVPATDLPNATGLIYQTRNSNILGSLVFPVRNGNPTGSLQVSAGLDQTIPSGTFIATLAGTASAPGGGD